MRTESPDPEPSGELRGAIPTLRTERLLLRPFSLSDAPRVQELAGSREVASTTLTVPHPYEDGLAETWIDGRAAAWKDGESLTLAVTTTADGLVGAMGLDLAAEHERGLRTAQDGRTGWTPRVALPRRRRPASAPWSLPSCGT